MTTQELIQLLAEALEIDARPATGEIMCARFLPQAVAVVAKVQTAGLPGPDAVVSERHVHEREGAAAIAQLVPNCADVFGRGGKADDRFGRAAGIRHHVAPDSALSRLGPGEQREQGSWGLARGRRRRACSKVSLLRDLHEAGKPVGTEEEPCMLDSHAVEDDPEDSFERFD